MTVSQLLDILREFPLYASVELQGKPLTDSDITITFTDVQAVKDFKHVDMEV